MAEIHSANQDNKQISLEGPQMTTSLMKKMIDLFNVDTFVETGTWGGGTAEKASSYFKEVYTVELDNDLFERGRNRLKNYSNIHYFQDDSPNFIINIVPTIQGKILFWLDAHWCGEYTARSDKNTPIYKELQSIKASGLKNSIILIDDVRCFHNFPDEFPEFGGYPSINEIKKLILDINPEYHFCIIGDIVCAFSSDEDIEVTPLVENCTISRLFNVKDPDYSEVLLAEQAIQNHAYDSDAEAIQKLQCYVVPSTEFITFHLILWKGLIHLGKKEYSQAIDCFNRTQNAGYHHWRVTWYLAQAYYFSERFSEAKEQIENVKREAPDFIEPTLLNFTG